jgi:hypothetical protein
MAIRIIPELDKKKFESDLAGLRARVGDELKKAGDDGGQKLEAALGDRLKKMNIQDALGAFGKAKEIFDATATSLFGMNEATAKAVSNTADLALKGGELGAMFGPWGAAIGAAGGAFAGLAIEIKKAREESEAFMGSVLGVGFMAKVAKAKVGLGQQKEQKDIAGASAALAALGGAFKGIAEATGSYGAGIAKATTATRSFGGAAGLAADELRRMNEEFSRAPRALQDNIGKGLAAMGAANQGMQSAIDAQLAGTGAHAASFNRVLKEFDTSFKEAGIQAENFSAPTLNALGMIQQGAKEAGIEIKSALGGIATQGAMALFDALEDGQPILKSLGKTFQNLASDALKGIGAQLVGQGILDAAKGLGLLIRSAGLDPRAAPLMGHGAAQIAGGLALGGAGALVGRAGMGGGGGGGGAGGGGLGKSFRSEEPSGPTVLPPVYYSAQSGFAMPRDPGPSGGGASVNVDLRGALVAGSDHRALAELGDRIADAISAALSSGPSLSGSHGSGANGLFRRR